MCPQCQDAKSSPVTWVHESPQLVFVVPGKVQVIIREDRLEFMKSSHLVCRFCQLASPSLSLQAVGMDCPGYCSGGQQRAHYSVRETEQHPRLLCH